MRWVAVALLTALGATACSDDGAPSGRLERAEPPTVVVETTTSTTEPALLGQDLVVVDQGVTAFPDPFDRSATLGTYGVVLRNPNPDVMAVGVRVVTRILGKAGEPLVEDSTLLNAVMPGEQMALGRTLIEPVEGPTLLTVSIEVSAWLLPATEEGDLIAVDVTTEPEANGGAVTKFTVRSTWPSQEEGVDVTAIYRAADGRLLGAESATLGLVPPETDTPAQIRLLSPIPDVATTDVFVGRGLAAQTTG